MEQQGLTQRYMATGLLGEGGMAEVFRAWDSQDRTWCAIKMLRETYASRESSRSRFVTEGETVIALDHRNVIDAWDIVSTVDRPFLVMEIAEGGSLKDWVDLHGRMPPRLAVDVAIQISKGVGAAHEFGVVHRDIKPHNILLSRKGQCKVTDFGIAKVMRPDGSVDIPDARTMQTQNAMGTLGYMAPEQRTNPHSADERTDIYGIGATLYTLLTGRVVTNLFIAEREPQLLVGIPEELVPVLMQATAYKEDQRYATVKELAKALFEAGSLLPLDPEAPPLEPTLEPEPPPPPPTTALVRAGASARTPPVRTPAPLSPPVVAEGWSTPPPMARRFQPRTYDDDDEPQHTRPLIVIGALVGLFMALVLLDAAWVTMHARQAREARDAMASVVSTRAGVVDNLVTVGLGDRAVLEELMHRARTTPSPEVTAVASERYIEALREAHSHVEQVTGGTAAAERDIVALERQHQVLEQQLEGWRSASRTPGVAVRMGLARGSR
ncbi:MAG: serine/threonine protein kinase [Myxococcales bacterium]|nr:serine/threonine protein kinase [Myxococcales bacterium]